MTLVSFDTHWKHQKSFGFLMFSGSIKRDHRHKMGWLLSQISSIIDTSQSIKYVSNVLRDCLQISLLIVGNKAKEQISKRVFQESKARQIFWKTNISYPLIAPLPTPPPCYPVNISYPLILTPGKKCSFYGKFGALCFIETSVLRFALFPYYRRNV